MRTFSSFAHLAFTPASQDVGVWSRHLAIALLAVVAAVGAALGVQWLGAPPIRRHRARSASARALTMMSNRSAATP